MPDVSLREGMQRYQEPVIRPRMFSSLHVDMKKKILPICLGGGDCFPDISRSIFGTLLRNLVML